MPSVKRLMGYRTAFSGTLWAIYFLILNLCTRRDPFIVRGSRVAVVYQNDIALLDPFLTPPRTFSFVRFSVFAGCL